MMQAKKVYQFILIMFCILTHAAYADSQHNIEQAQFLTLSDIHFNPFASCESQSSCPLINALKQAPSTQWAGILAGYQTQISSYKTDSNYPLLHSALQAAHQQVVAQNIKLVMVLGDYLAHNYQARYVQYSGDNTAIGYQAFVRKTQEFLAAELAQAFPDQNIFMAVGNNDSYNDDYAVEPYGQFYQDMANLWSGLIKDKQAQAAMKQQFPAGGYYAVDVPNQPKVRLIVINSILFSMKAQGNGIDQAASQQLEWFHNELETIHARHQKALIIEHIPAGIDVYKSLAKTVFTAEEFWKPEYTRRFQAELQQSSDSILGLLAGHLHMDFAQVINGHIPMSGVPSISPLFGNNPSFKIYQYSSESLNNFSTYFYPLNNSQEGWSEEYNFNNVYQPDCKDCYLAKGMSLLQPESDLVNRYINYFAVSTNSQPISTQWMPYYWCAINTITAVAYQSCMNESR